MKQVREFFRYARERYLIMLRRSTGQPPPWTNDPVLQQYRFCNVFREDDTTTIWIRKNLRDPLTNDPKVLMAMIVARFFNRISTLQALKPIILTHGWHEQKAMRILAKLKPPIVTAAYMLKTPPVLTKSEGIAQILRPFAPDAEHLGINIHRDETTMQGLHEVLCEYPYVGKFMAYEIVTDMRFTQLMGNPPDRNSWASAGPGAARGLSRVVYGELGHYNYHSDEDQEMLNKGMVKLLKMSWGKLKLWPLEWPSWEMREVEHTLCEFDKYERARLGEGRPKQLFRHGYV